jgi:hypothetical protein
MLKSSDFGAFVALLTGGVKEFRAFSAMLAEKFKHFQK